MEQFMSGAGAKKREKRGVKSDRSEDAYAEWADRSHIASHARDNHVFGYGVGGAGRHEQVVNGTTPLEFFAKKDAPLPTSTESNLTHWRDDKEAVPRRRERKGRPQGIEGVSSIDIDGDGFIDAEEVLISSQIRNEKPAHLAEWSDPMFHGDGRTNKAERKLSPRTVQRKKHQAVEQGRKEMLRRYWHENRDMLWCIDPKLRGQQIGESIETLLQTCENSYQGNFALMMRNLHHDAEQLRSHSSVQAQMVLRPPVTCRMNASLEQEGYKDGYNTVRLKEKERISRVYAQIKQEGKGALNPSGVDYSRRKGTEYAYGNMAGWCAARAKHPFNAHM